VITPSPPWSPQGAARVARVSEILGVEPQFGVWMHKASATWSAGRPGCSVRVMLHDWDLSGVTLTVREVFQGHPQLVHNIPSVRVKNLGPLVRDYL
jgi:hypothetical protein